MGSVPTTPHRGILRTPLPSAARPSTWAAALVFLLLFAGGVGGSQSLVPTTPSPTPASPATNHTTPYIRHVVFIVLENQVASSVWAHAPYERYLARTYGNATQFYAACHPSSANYLAMFAAVTNQCGTDVWHLWTNRTLGDALVSNGYSWAAYAENLSLKGCASPWNATLGLFATRHVPSLYFASSLANLRFCHTHLLTSQRFQRDVVNGTLTNLSLYTPNLCHDGHTGCGGNSSGAQMAAQADAWLNGFLAPILNHTGTYNTPAERSMVNHTLFVVTWDEGSGSNAGFAVPYLHAYDNAAWCKANGARGDAVCGGHIYTAFVSKYSRGLSFTQNDSFYGLARTVEWLFHLPPLGNTGKLDTRAGLPAMKGLFTFRSNGH